MDKKYQITLNERQLRLISFCVEDIHRFMGGQMELSNCTSILDNRRLIQGKLNECYNLVVPELASKYGYGASYGWNGGDCPNEHQRKFLAESYYLYREILHFLVKKNSNSEWNVYNSPTLTCEDSGEPIEIKEL